MELGYHHKAWMYTRRSFYKIKGKLEASGSLVDLIRLEPQVSMVSSLSCMNRAGSVG